MKKPKGGTKTYTVDGFDRETNTVYQFNGCYWHGCEKCNQIHCERQAKTEELPKLIRHSDMNLVEMRECEWEKMKTEMDEEKRKRLEKRAWRQTINTRDALC